MQDKAYQVNQIVDLARKHYTYHVKVHDSNVFALMPMALTWGIGYGMSLEGVAGRYCFRDPIAAMEAFMGQDNIDADTPPYELTWITHKGRIDYSPRDLELVYRTGAAEYDDCLKIAERCKQVLTFASSNLIDTLERA